MPGSVLVLCIIHMLEHSIYIFLTSGFYLRGLRAQLVTRRVRRIIEIKMILKVILKGIESFKMVRNISLSLDSYDLGYSRYGGVSESRSKICGNRIYVIGKCILTLSVICLKNILILIMEINYFLLLIFQTAWESF